MLAPGSLPMSKREIKDRARADARAAKDRARAEKAAAKKAAHEEKLAAKERARNRKSVDIPLGAPAPHAPESAPASVSETQTNVSLETIARPPIQAETRPESVAPEPAPQPATASTSASRPAAEIAVAPASQSEPAPAPANEPKLERTFEPEPESSRTQRQAKKAEKAAARQAKKAAPAPAAPTAATAPAAASATAATSTADSAAASPDDQKQPHAARNTCIVLLLLLLIAVGLVLAAWLGLFRLPSPVQDRIDLLPDPYAQQGRLNAEDSPVAPGSYRLVLNQIPGSEPGSRDVAIEFENPAQNTYSARLDLYLDDTGQLVGSTRMISPGTYLATMALSEQLPPGTYQATAKVGVYSGATQVNTMTAAVELRIKG